MKQRDNRIRVPSVTKNVRENNEKREAGPSLDRNLNILLFRVMHSGNLEASLAPGDEGSHKAPKIESFSLKQLFLDLSLKCAVYNIFLISKSDTVSDGVTETIAMNILKVFEPDALNTFCATGVYKVKALKKMFALVAFATQKFCSF